MVRMVFGYKVIFWIDHRGNRGGAKVLRLQQKKQENVGILKKKKTAGRVYPNPTSIVI